MNYDHYLHYTWTYFYFGYSRTERKAHVYVKFVTREHHLDFNNVLNFVPTIMYVQMSKDKWHGGYNGMLKYWYLNGGKGSYREKDYGEGESDELTFGYAAGLDDREFTKEWEFEEDIIDNEFDVSETKV